VADFFDAMTSARAYRPAMPIDHAVRILEDGAGKQFQPEFVRAFVEGALPVIRVHDEPIRFSENGLTASPAGHNLLSFLSTD
jgi:response regulator RpfG family c-di-GMP phosphodiesterase